MTVRLPLSARAPGRRRVLPALAVSAALLGVLPGAAAGDTACKAPAAPSDFAEIEPYKLNYGQVYGRDSKILAHDPTARREPQEARFQLSFKKRVLDCMPLYFAYTQNSFWQVYDESASRPFRETNFNPEAFVTTPNGPVWEGARLGLQLGFEHESNGRGIETLDGEQVNLSRSWNRAYIWPRLLLGAEAELIVSFKWWGRWPEDPKTYPLDPHGDDNPDIQDTLGRGELRVVLAPTEDLRVLYLARRGRKDTAGTTRLDLLYHLEPLSPNVWVHLQYFHGYGESLIDYDRSVQRVGIGMAVGDPARHYREPGADVSPRASSVAARW